MKLIINITEHYTSSCTRITNKFLTMSEFCDVTLTTYKAYLSAQEGHMHTPC